MRYFPTMTVLEQRLWKLSDPAGRFEGPVHVYRLGFCVTCGVVARDCMNLGGWEEAEHPRDDQGEFTESSGGGDDKGGKSTGRSTGLGPSGSSGSQPTSHGYGGSGGGGMGVSKTAPSEKFTKSAPVPETPIGTSQTAPAKDYGTGPKTPFTTPTPIPPVSGKKPTAVRPPATYTVLPEKVKTKADDVFKAMKPDEADAFMQGYNDAITEGYTKEPADWLIEQAALYQHAPEGDPRIKTFFYGDTLEALLRDPETKALIDQTTWVQEGAGQKKSSGGGGGGGKAPDPAKEAAAQAKKDEAEKKKAATAAAKEQKDAEAAAKKEAKAKEKAAKDAAKAKGEADAEPPPSSPGGEAGDTEENVRAVVTQMLPEEQMAFAQGFVDAQEAGYGGTIFDYFVQQVALYPQALHGDPRFQWLSQATMSRISFDPVLMARVQQVASSQPALVPYKKPKVKQLHDYRLGFCLTCGSVARDCINLGGAGSGNFGHGGRPGEVGGSSDSGTVKVVAKDGSEWHVKPAYAEAYKNLDIPAVLAAMEKEKQDKYKSILDAPLAISKDQLTVAPTAPPKDVPLTVMFGGSFNPPHEGHVKSITDAVKLLEDSGYKVGKVIVAPTADKLLTKKLGDKMYPLEERTELAKRTFTDPRIEVSSGPGKEAEAETGKLRRTQLADWGAKHNKGTNVVNVTGQDAAPGSPPAFPSLYEGDKGTSHEGYHYLAVKRDESAGGPSSTKIRTALKEGTPVPDMTPQAEAYLRDMLARHPSIKLSYDTFEESWVHLGGAGSGNFGHAGRPGAVGGSAPAERAPDSGSGEGGGTAALEAEVSRLIANTREREASASTETPLLRRGSQTTLTSHQQAELDEHIKRLHTSVVGENPVGTNAADLATIQQPPSAYPSSAPPPSTVQEQLDGSLYLHTVPGKALDRYGLALTPERQALHDAIARQYIRDATKVEKPYAVVLGGGPASGKSTMLAQDPSLTDNTVRVDPDEIRLLLPEYQDTVRGNNPMAIAKHAGSFTHEEASLLAKRIAAEAGPHFNVVIDSAGDNTAESMEKKIAGYRAQGQKVIARYSTNDVETAVKWSQHRETSPPYRAVPEETLRKTHRGVSQTLPKLLDRDAFDEVELWETGGKETTRVMSKTRGTQPVIHDQAAWDRFLAKGK